MRNPLRSVANVAVAMLATIALAPFVVTPTSAYARGGGGGGGGRGGRGGNPGGRGGSGGGNPGGRGGSRGGTGGPNSGGRGGGKGGSKGNQSAGQAAKNNPIEYLLLIQQDDSDDHRTDFLIDALDAATVNQRDKDRAAALNANRDAASKLLRADDMPRP
jgi:hypothetical protein